MLSTTQLPTVPLSGWGPTHTFDPTHQSKYVVTVASDSHLERLKIAGGKVTFFFLYNILPVLSFHLFIPQTNPPSNVPGGRAALVLDGGADGFIPRLNLDMVNKTFAVFVAYSIDFAVRLRTYDTLRNMA